MTTLRADEEERLEECRVAALEFANDVIARVGGTPQRALAPGVPRDCHHCSIAETIRAGGVEIVSTKHVHTYVGRLGEIEHPEAVAEFSAYFDHRLYEDLIR